MASPTQTLRLGRVYDPAALSDAWTDAAALARWISPLPGHDAEVPAFDPARPLEDPA